ncbi:unnamed protein product [marine sediment metagenome]|uniref:Uncharacterized protein n=1 Tax=marine sediment metagenome TaxID=412755 RepID=X0VPV8_9ZZZZ
MVVSKHRKLNPYFSPFESEMFWLKEYSVPDVIGVELVWFKCQVPVQFPYKEQFLIPSVSVAVTLKLIFVPFENQNLSVG